MASREGYQLLQENDEGSNDSISNSGPSAAPTAEDYRDFTASSPPVLEPSKDKGRHPDGIHGIEKRLTHSCPQPSAKKTKEASISSSGETNGPEDEQQNDGGYQNSEVPPVEEPTTSCCMTLWNCYNDYARIIRNSWFIYIFQLFVSVLVVSCIVMAIVFFASCSSPYPSTGPVLTILAGIAGFLFVYKWVAMVCRERRGQRFWNLERFWLAVRFFIFMFFFGLELYFFRQVSPSNLTFRRDIKCDPIYFYYMHYWHIANGASLVLGALLYLPASIIYFINWNLTPVSNANGHYQPL